MVQWSLAHKKRSHIPNPLYWKCGSHHFELSQRPLLMGILNVTPDSFSDGYPTLDQAISQAEKLIEAGADLIDIGGESTRPGSQSVPVEQELKRVMPVIEALVERVPLSLDTQKAEVAKAGADAGVAVINHVSSNLDILDMLTVLEGSNVGYLAMHMPERPKTMQEKPDYRDVIEDVAHALEGVSLALRRHKIDPARVLFDPGIGFGKTLEHNLELLRHTKLLSGRLGRPLVMGLSRKRWLDHLLDLPLEERDPFTAMASMLMPHPAVAVHRVHNVAMVKKALLLKSALDG